MEKTPANHALQTKIFISRVRVRVRVKVRVRVR